MTGSGRPEIAASMTRSMASWAIASRARGTPPTSESSTLPINDATAMAAKAIRPSIGVSGPSATSAANTTAPAIRTKRARLSRFQKSPAGAEARSASIAIGLPPIAGLSRRCRPISGKIQGEIGIQRAVRRRGRNLAGTGSTAVNRLRSKVFHGLRFYWLDFRPCPAQPKLANAEQCQGEPERHDIVEQAEQQQTGQQILFVILPKRHQH